MTTLKEITDPKNFWKYYDGKETFFPTDIVDYTVDEDGEETEWVLCVSASGRTTWRFN